MQETEDNKESVEETTSVPQKPGMAAFGGLSKLKKAVETVQ